MSGLSQSCSEIEKGSDDEEWLSIARGGGSARCASSEATCGSIGESRRVRAILSTALRSTLPSRGPPTCRTFPWRLLGLRGGVNTSVACACFGEGCCSTYDRSYASSRGSDEHRQNFPNHLKSLILVIDKCLSRDISKESQTGEG